MDKDDFHLRTINCVCGHPSHNKTCEKCGCPEDSYPDVEDSSENSEVLDKFVRWGILAGYSLKKIYEEPGVEIRTSQELTLIFPMGHTLTVGAISSGVMENVALILETGSLLTDK